MLMVAEMGFHVAYRDFDWDALNIQEDRKEHIGKMTDGAAIKKQSKVHLARASWEEDNRTRDVSAKLRWAWQSGKLKCQREQTF